MGDTVAGSGGREGELVGRLYRELKQNQVSPAQYYQQYHALKLVPECGTEAGYESGTEAGYGGGTKGGYGGTVGGDGTVLMQDMRVVLRQGCYTEGGYTSAILRQGMGVCHAAMERVWGYGRRQRGVCQYRASGTEAGYESGTKGGYGGGVGGDGAAAMAQYYGRTCGSTERVVLREGMG
eukprot:3940843-Rhodomonas_salina.1